MTQTLQHRKPSAQRRRSVGRLPAQPPRRRRLSRPYSVFLLAMTYGTTVALLVVTVGFTTLLRNGTAVTQEALQLQRAGAGGGHGHGGGHGGGPKPNIKIVARHVGNLALNIKAEISMNQDRDPLIKAKVVAFTDMVQMPGVHTQGPLPLQAVPGTPGTYETTANLSMPGDYEVRLEVKDPVQGQKTTTVAVSTTSYDIDAPERQAQSQKGREP